MNIGVTPKASPINLKPDNQVYVLELPDDEINQGEFFRKLFSQWNAILTLMVAGFLLLPGSCCLSVAHPVKAVLRLLANSEPGDMNNQGFLETSRARVISLVTYKFTLPGFSSEPINKR